MGCPRHTNQKIGVLLGEETLEMPNLTRELLLDPPQNMTGVKVKWVILIVQRQGYYLGEVWRSFSGRFLSLKII